MRKLITVALILIISFFLQRIDSQSGLTSATTHPSQPAQVATALGSDFFVVARVADGDTFSVQVGTTTETIRMIGVNTPETVDPRRPVECFGKEASAFTKSILMHTSVRLVADTTQSNRDKYGRLLRYVYLEDGRLFNQLLIEEGYAYEYTYDKPYLYQQQFKDAQVTAKSAKKGLWGNALCVSTR
ncbi:MAG: hypothetical protein RL094_682 [Candidatus Parcubacteria bacterium]